MVFLIRKMAVTPLVSLGLADKVYMPGIIFIKGKLKYVPGNGKSNSLSPYR